MNFPIRPTLGGLAAALTIPKLLPDAFSLMCSAASFTASRSWEYIGSPLLEQGTELGKQGWNFTAANASWAANRTLELLATPTGETLLGYEINIGTILGVAILTGTAAGLAIARLENRFPYK